MNGSYEPAYERVAAAVDASVDDPTVHGAAAAVVVNGRVVVDVATGTARASDAIEWETSTRSIIFSCGKGVLSLVVAVLVARGDLELDAPVVRYWPAFGARGKGGITVRDVLAHRAGLLAPVDELLPGEVPDDRRMAHLLAAQPPLWRPGTGWAYHAVTFGALVTGLTLGATGLTPAQVMGRTFTGGHLDELRMGLEASEVAELATLSFAPGFSAPPAGLDPWASHWYERSFFAESGSGPFDLDSAGRQNVLAWARAHVGGSAMVGSARSLAELWGRAARPEGRADWGISDDAWSDVTSVASHETPLIDTGAARIPFGAGFQLGMGIAGLGLGTVGHAGAGGQIAFADTFHRVGFAFLTNHLRADEPGAQVVRALAQSLTDGNAQDDQ